MQVRLFGELEVWADGVLVPVRGVKQRTLLAVLALARGEPVGVERLIDVLWADGPVTHPANALQAQVGQLRRALGPAAIKTTASGYALDVRLDQVDVLHFAQLMGDGRRVAAQGQPAQASAVLSEALALRRGEPLGEFAYAEFASAERAQLNELAVQAVEARADADLALGRDAELVADLEAACREHPLRERLSELLILALYRAGRQAEALRVYRATRNRLVEELGIDPGPALRDLETRLLGQDPSLMLPERTASSPAGAGTERAGRGPGNVQPRLDRFVGREDEVEQLRRALGDARLVTLVGPGGAGKTRLAVEVAASLREQHPDGAWLVELAGLTDPGGVATSVAAALGATAAVPAGPQPAGSTVELIVKHLAGRSPLVVLDNCEHVIGPAAALAEALVTAVPGLRLVATSREPLGVPGELLLPVAGLATAAAVELFAERARAVRPGFVADAPARAVVESICARLDGLPLAVELAAARLRALPLATVAERLDDRFRLLTTGARTALPRQQTLRAVVDWSYDLLFDDERRLFARLSVFPGGCCLAAVEAVCSDEHVPVGEVLDTLSRLVDKSLVMVDLTTSSPRYSQLQTLSQYARERLKDSGEAEQFRERHARWYLALAEQARPGLRGPDGVGWRATLDTELDNLRAGFDWFIGRRDATSALQLVRGISYLWFLRADFRDGFRWLTEVLAVDPPGPRGLRGHATAWRAYFGLVELGPTAALDSCREAVVELRQAVQQGQEVEAPGLLGQGLLVLADLLHRHGQLEAAQTALAEAFPLLVAADEAWGLAAHDIFAARNLAALGRPDQAERCALAGVARLRACGEQWMILYGLGMLAGLQESRGDLTSAAAAYEELVEACRSAQMVHFAAMWLIRLGAVRARLGDDAVAERLFADAAAANPRGVNPAALLGRAAAARRLGDLDSSRRWLDEARVKYDAIGLPAGAAAAATGLAWWHLAAGDLPEAQRTAEHARRRAAQAADPLVVVLAEAVAAAVALAASDTRANRDGFGEALRRRSAAGRSAAFLEGTLDDPDIDAIALAHGLAVR